VTEPESLVLKHLKEIRTEIGGLRTELAAVKEEQVLTTRKIGTLAESVVSLRNEVHGLRTDVRMVALAVDEHTARLDRIEGHLGLHGDKH
jgi:hypothetical protein